MANTLAREYDECFYKDAVPGYQAEGTVVSTYVKRSTLTSDKVKGQFISIHGNQFRKATPLVKSTFVIVPANPQYTGWKKLISGTYRDAYTRSSTGGGRLGFVSSNMSLTSSSGDSVKCLATQVNHLSSMQNEAVTKALVKMADQKVNLGENLATLGSTLRLIGTPTMNLVNSLRSAWNDRKLRPYLSESYRQLRRRRAAARLPTDIADRYLEYVYGWKPMMEDIYTLVEMAKDNSENPLLLNARGSSTREYYIRPQTFSDSSGGHVTRVEGGGADLRTTRCSIWAKVLPEHAGLRALNQLGLVNPFSLVWELVPWSFVVDWVLPLGPVFQALTAPAGLQFVDGTISTRQRVRCSYEQEKVSGITRVTSSSPANGTFLKDSYSRTVLSSWPAPGFWVDTDPFRGDRPFKAIALAISNLQGLRNF